MKLEPPMSAMRRHAVTLLWAVLLLPLASCLELDTRTCSEDLTCPSTMRCSGDGSACISTPCGNSILEVGEECDDGNLRDGDGCSKDCRATGVCGNGMVDPGEACDDGNHGDGDGCSANCKSKEKCGNGIVDAAAGEVCDDGNTMDGDGCSANCRSDERCGNHVTDTALGEVCDDGNMVDGDGCSADCRSGESCGNGIRDSTEDCDENGETARCNSNCTFSVCGDGIRNVKAGEECDEGSANGHGNCLANCKLNTCGDGIRQSWEICDDGNTDACGTCGSSCQEYRLMEATGSIIAVGKDYLNDGETFTLSNGINPPRIFEFDKNGIVEPGSVRVVIQDAAGASDVARVMVNAINATAGLSLRAEQNVNPAMVNLTNVTRNPRAGAFGNQRITETVANSGFKVNGMAGGGASDCPAGMSCIYGEDCASGNCTNGFCVQ